jgi:16S rRNA G966 N2-methylase RsmD
MHERIDHGANLLKNHVFQFDFLNDDFTKLPQSLQDIINNPQKRKKLVIYINPPYAEAASKKTLSGVNKNKTNVSVKTKVYSKYFSNFGIS